MHFPFCAGKRWGKGRREAKVTSKSPISWTPSSHGQLESERLIAGDFTAFSDLSTLITRAGATSARVPHLDSNGVVATSELLRGHTKEGISHLAEDKAAAQRRSQASRPWTFGSLFFSNASLIGEDFQQSLKGLCDQGSRESVHIENKATRSIPCPGHWQLVFCPNQDCSSQHSHAEAPQSRPLTAEGVERLSDRPVPLPFETGQRASLTSSLEEELNSQEAEEQGEEFLFDAHLRDEGEYEQALCEIAAIAARPGSPKLISLTRKHQVEDAEAVSTALELNGQPTDVERWSTQAQTGCPQACAEVSKGKVSLQSSRLSLKGPPSGPPSIPLPPNPPSPVNSLPLRSSE
ncbi:hypothetical protein LA080_001171 [Diaporthe eres]|nr:hypothetical protein LA080_001171 [Diaporthe eres]